MFIISALSNMGAEVRCLLSQNSTISQVLYTGALACSNMWKSNYPHRHINTIALRFL